MMWLLQLLVVCVAVSQVSCGVADGLQYVGVGYNLLTGNPDIISNGGVDPGLLYTRKILAISPGSHPPQVYVVSRTSCLSTSSYHSFFDAESYQEKLGHSIDIGAEGTLNVSSKLMPFEFSLNHQYSKVTQQMSQKHQVLLDVRKDCNYGTLRYHDELVASKHFTLTEMFAVAACKLSTAYNEAAYMKFLDTWGTHVTTKVDVGEQHVTRFQSSITDFFQHVQSNSANAVSLGGSYEGYEASLAVNFDIFKKNTHASSNFGSQLNKTNTGSKTHPEPVHVWMKPISVVFDPKYWTNLATFHKNRICPTSVSTHSIQLMQKNLHTAIARYANYKHAKLASAHTLKIPIDWPLGTYGLPRPSSGCPGNKVHWAEGYRTSELMSHSPHISLGFITEPHRDAHATLHHRNKKGYISEHYCIKGDKTSSPYSMDWPEGNYCIYKYGSFCPKKFIHQGSIPTYEPTLGISHPKHSPYPDGANSNNVEFCCRDDALPAHKIVLPPKKAFYLFPYTRGCQQVHGTSVAEQYVEKYMQSSHHPSGAHPTISGKKIMYCYYTPAVHTGTIIG